MQRVPTDVARGRRWVYERMLYFPRAEYRRRREKLWHLWGKPTGILLLGVQDESHIYGKFSQRTTFEYFTGYREPGASLFLVPRGKRGFDTVLFLPPVNPETERWEGRRFDPESSRTPATLGVDYCFPTTELDRVITRYRLRRQEIGTYVPVDRYEKEQWTYPEGTDLKKFLKSHDLHGSSISRLVAAVRRIKSPLEVACHLEADRITGLAFQRVFKNWKQYRNEREIQADVEGAFLYYGGSGPAYSPIVAAGFNATALHYRNNDFSLNTSQAILMDVGARYNGYAADITRVLPRSGKFSKRQREVYEIVLESQKRAIARVRPGVTWQELNDTAWGYLKTKGFEKWHGVGHYLGMDVHDVGDNKEPFVPGVVHTIEPGVYLPDEGIGVRIEDDVLVTKTGCRVLSSMIPKEVSELERLCK